MSDCYIKGTFTKSIYETSSGYTIGIFRVRETNDQKIEHYIGRSITFTGYFHELNTIDTYLFYGKLVEHEKYGEQFQVDHYERSKIEEKDSLVEFLSSGLFKGIGEKKAKTIVEVLGKDTLKIILENPDNLILIPGITEKNIQILHNKLKEYEASYESILFLTEKGFSNKDAMNIYHYYKKETKNIIENNIYQLIDDVIDMSFKKIDMIYLRNGGETNSSIRLQAAILYVMKEFSNTYGHCYIYFEEILSLTSRVLGLSLDQETLSHSLQELSLNSRIVIKEERYYLKEMYDAECLIVKRFRLLNSNPPQASKSVKKKLLEIEKNLMITYNSLQLEAIEKSYERDFLMITGGPGTGKTTILKGILELYKEMHHLSYSELCSKVALLAPTGRAAKRMSEATFFPASTIHRFLKWQKDTNTFQVNEYNKSKVEFIILDETSMVDTYLMAHLLRGISSNCKIVLIGDDHQLPSVGPGQVLHDLIQSDSLEKMELTELYRQGNDSNIISLAYDIRNQYVQKDIFNNGEDLTFIECSDKEVIPNILEICDSYKDYSFRDFQILVPMYKGMNGIDQINEKVQNVFNPKKDRKKEHKIGDVLFREEDKVIQLTNMPDDNVYNGDIGLIQGIRVNPKSEIYIDFDGNQVKYTPSNYNNFRQAYAISVHKAQGSEFEIVVIPIVKGYQKMLYQKLIYTAVTRAKKKLFLIGDFKALEYASQNVWDDIRRTTIKEYFIQGIK